MGCSTVGIIVAIVLPIVVLSKSSSHLDDSRQVVGHTYTSYCRGRTCNASFPLARPTSLEEIQTIIKTALEANATVKAIGNLHSDTDIICTEGIPISMKRINHFKYNKSSELVTVGAGITVANLLKQLHSIGRSLTGSPFYSDITIGGALGTGPHGSSLHYPTTISDQMVRLRVVDGVGNVKDITKKQEVNAFRVHVGLLGVIYEVTLKTVPEFKLMARTVHLNDDILGDPERVKAMARSHSYLYLMWFPTAHTVYRATWDVVVEAEADDCEFELIQDFNREATTDFVNLAESLEARKNHEGLFHMQKGYISSLKNHYLCTSDEGKKSPQNPAIGVSTQMISGMCDTCAWHHEGDSSFGFDAGQVTIPLSQFGPAMQMTKRIFDEYPLNFYVFGVLIRFITPSEGMLNMNRGAESFTLEFILVARKDRGRDPKVGLGAVQAVTQALVKEFNGRLHWGKNGELYRSHEMITFMHHKYHKSFVKMMEKMDPHGVFLNDFGRRFRFGHSQNLEHVKHCALLDYCICKTDLDCGPGGRMDYKCRQFHGYNVCADPDIGALSSSRDRGNYSFSTCL